MIQDIEKQYEGQFRDSLFAKLPGNDQTQMLSRLENIQAKRAKTIELLDYECKPEKDNLREIEEQITFTTQEAVKTNREMVGSSLEIIEGLNGRLLDSPNILLYIDNKDFDYLIMGLQPFIRSQEGEFKYKLQDSYNSMLAIQRNMLEIRAGRPFDPSLIEDFYRSVINLLDLVNDQTSSLEDLYRSVQRRRFFRKVRLFLTHFFFSFVILVLAVDKLMDFVKEHVLYQIFLVVLAAYWYISEAYINPFLEKRYERSYRTSLENAVNDYFTLALQGLLVAKPVKVMVNLLQEWGERIAE
jgi:hypothetical protein